MTTRQESIEHDFVERKLAESIENKTLLTSVFFVRETDGKIGACTLVNDVDVSKQELLFIGKYLLARAQDCAKGLNA